MQRIYEVDLEPSFSWDYEDSYVDKLEMMIQLRDIAEMSS